MTTTYSDIILEEIREELGRLQIPTLDISDLLIAIRSLPTPPSADAIAQAIVSKLTFPQQEDIRPALDKVAEALRDTQSRVAEVPKMAFGNGVTIKNKTTDPVPVEVIGGSAGSSTGGLTDDELRASPVAVSGTVSVSEPVTVDGTVGVSGTVPVSGTFWQATQPVSGTVTSNAGTGTRTTKEVRSATATHSNVVASALNATLLASNANRLGATIYNDSTGILYLKLGASASSTSFTVKMIADAYFETPYEYTGIIDGAWAVGATGSARIVEFS